MKKPIKSLAALGAVAVAAVAGSSLWASQAESVPLSEVSHIHGISVDPSDPARLYLATHYGVWRTSPDGTADQVSQNSDDYMGFTPHPSEAGTFFGSGHPETGGNAGFIVSRDGAETWEQLAPGADGPVDFHAMAVSAADPAVIYGLYGKVQVSRDGGSTWSVAGAPPADVYDIAASSADPDTVYAATGTGPMVSTDGARTWKPSGPEGRPASLVEVAPGGTVYAFVIGSGLLKRSASDGEWQSVGNDFGERVLLHLAADPGDPDRLFAVTQESQILTSTDGGSSWAPLTS
ncbi:MAG: exo-alpha-sialidase [Aurantimonas endophytica]|uniref:sialidase family protein n=1 Tax=Aurantimonas endophytica TaxID=1522175 RepID=UPI0030022EFC